MSPPPGHPTPLPALPQKRTVLSKIPTKEDAKPTAQDLSLWLCSVPQAVFKKEVKKEIEDQYMGKNVISPVGASNSWTRGLFGISRTPLTGTESLEDIVQQGQNIECFPPEPMPPLNVLVKFYPEKPGFCGSKQQLFCEVPIGKTGREGAANLTSNVLAPDDLRSNHPRRADSNQDPSNDERREGDEYGPSDLGKHSPGCRVPGAPQRSGGKRQI